MESGPTPEGIRRAEFRSALRGLDRVQVEEFLGGVAARMEQLESEIERLHTQIGETSTRDLETEFDAVGKEVAGILQSAREAADAMRDRASADSARWRTEAAEEAEGHRKSAAADAEALRRDAWATGTEMLEQAAKEANKLKEESEREVLTIMGEAEREAHRLTSSARREAEDVLRSANMDAEKITSEAGKRRDDMIDVANRQAAAAQERTRALEQRRDELLEELENVRSTLTRLEGSLEERRESLDLYSESTTVKVVTPSPQEDDWELGETVRLVREPTAPAAPVVDESEPEPEEEAAPEPEIIEPLVIEETEVDTEGISEPVGEPEPTVDEVGALFASLRSGSEHEEAEPDDVVEAPQPQPQPQPEPHHESTDWIEVRDARLLPITNRALRGTKKAMTELQNIALDSLRTDEEWRPDTDAMVRSIQAELIGVWAESYSAGHTVAEEMTGTKLKRPPTPSSKVAKEFAEALSADVASALDAAGTGQRERQSAASKVFRVWRTDEAERRIREMAIHSYEKAIERSVESDGS